MRIEVLLKNINLCDGNQTKITQIPQGYIPKFGFDGHYANSSSNASTYEIQIVGTENKNYPDLQGRVVFRNSVPNRGGHLAYYYMNNLINDICGNGPVWLEGLATTSVDPGAYITIYLTWITEQPMPAP
jgi:hypothetical protein